MKTLCILLCIIVCPSVFSQNCPPNIDFEQGDFSHWDCFTGTTSLDLNGKNVISLLPTGPVPGRHELIKGDSINAKDHYGNFPILCPYGSKYSVKLGNDQVGKEAEGLSYTFTAPALVDTFTFTYFYAVVFQDPNHSPAEQPRFFVTAYDVLSGNLINCASYNYVSSGSIPGFQTSKVQNDVQYKDWSPVSIQFVGLANRKIRLEFKTADCTRGAHFGYAYLDVGEGCSNILATAPYCKETNSILLNAPFGFQSYTWYNEDYSKVIGSQQSLTLSPPPATKGTFHVDMIPYPDFGCRDSADAEVIPLPVPDTPVARSNYILCQYTSISQLTATADRGNYLLWYNTGTGGTGNDIAPYFSTATGGLFPFYVSQKVLFGCESLRKKIEVMVSPTPNALYTANSYTQCQKDNQFVFTNHTTNTYSSIFSWDLGDGTISHDTSITHTYTNYGTYHVNLRVDNPPGCTSQVNKVITVVPKPVAAFGFPQVLCEKQTSFVLTDNSYVPGGLSTINTWNWLIDGQKLTGKQPSVFTPDKPGNLPVQLVVLSRENCESDTFSALPVVHYRPYANFRINNGLVCDNEILKFTDLSLLPPAAISEQIIKWKWKFDNAVINTQQPQLSFTAGNHTVNLVVESNYGCYSLPADSNFVVYPKPQIKLSINDSCVFRLIKYQANDLLGTVDKWRWDFGSGLFTGPNLIIKNYNKEGYRPLTLMAQTKFGCKDTIWRPFTIYDNKAFAGRDTIAAIDQPVQLNAHGGSGNNYVWTPQTGLSNDTIENPVATLNTDQVYLLDAITNKGCDSHSKISIRRFKGPELYIANAFTPDRDGLNDVLHVFPVGILSFESFSIYNRYGQRLFHTTDLTKGWDGNFNNQASDSGNYVAVAKAVDYKGNRMIKSVNVMLIR